MLVKPIATTERGELRAAGETCKRQVTESTTQVGRLEIRDTEQPLAPLRPSEVEGAGDIAALDPKPLQGRVEGLPSDRRVAHRDGEARARKDLVAHEERSVARIDAEDRTHDRLFGDRFAVTGGCERREGRAQTFAEVRT